MESQVKREKKSIIRLLPKDCWLHILQYLESPRDFLSLILTIKGLLQHICRIQPSSTKNISFKMKRIPNIKNEHVTNLKIGRKRGISYYLKLVNLFTTGAKTGGPSKSLDEFSNNFFSFIHTKFPNLSRLDFGLTHLVVFEGENSVYCPFFSLMNLSSEIGLPNLRVLELTISRCDVRFEKRGFLPNLEILDLTRVGTYLSLPNNFQERLPQVFETGNCDAEKLGLLEKNILLIDFGVIPRLFRLVLFGWHLKARNLDRLDRLEYLDLDHLSTEKKIPLTSFPNLHDLILRGEAISHVNDFFCRNSGPKTIEIDTKGRFLEVVDDKWEPDEAWHFRDNARTFIIHLPSLCDTIFLTKIKIGREQYDTFLSFSGDEKDQQEPFLIHNLPNLRVIDISNFHFDLQLSALPNLEYISLLFEDECGQYENDEIPEIDFLTKGEELRKLKQVDIFFYNVGKNLCPVFSNCKNLEVVSLVRLVERGEPTSLCFRNCEVLKSLKIEEVLSVDGYTEIVENILEVEEISNCPSLREVDIEIGEKVPQFKGSFDLERFSIFLPRNGDKTTIKKKLEHLLEQLTNTITAKSVIVKSDSNLVFVEKREFCESLLLMRRFKRVELKPPEGTIGRLENLNVDVESVVLMNLINLEKVKVKIRSRRVDPNHQKEVVIKSCPKLKELDIIIFPRENPKRNKYYRVHLEELPNLFELKMRDFFMYLVGSLVIRNVPITKLQVDFSSIKKRLMRSPFCIDGHNFPVLKFLVVKIPSHKCEVQIEKISCRTLENISIICLGEYTPKPKLPIVKSVEGIDPLRVVVKLETWKKEISLKEYFDYFKKKNVGKNVVDFFSCFEGKKLPFYLRGDF